jgi:hypothetical protein
VTGPPFHVKRGDPTGGPGEHVAASESLFRVVRGDPTPEELAALGAVLAATARAAAAARSHRGRAGPPPWGAPATHHRRVLPAPGPGAWRGLWTAEGTRFPPSGAGGADA